MRFNGSFILLLVAFIGLMSCSSTAQEREAAVEEIDNESVLIVYLTRTENTEAIAKIIHQQVGGEMVELKLERPYRNIMIKS